MIINLKDLNNYKLKKKKLKNLNLKKIHKIVNDNRKYRNGSNAEYPDPLYGNLRFGNDPSNAFR